MFGRKLSLTVCLKWSVWAAQQAPLSLAQLSSNCSWVAAHLEHGQGEFLGKFLQNYPINTDAYLMKGTESALGAQRHIQWN